ncbi:MAG: hypothetical protein ACOYKZ_00100 [Chlamydiia bacterium]
MTPHPKPSDKSLLALSGVDESLDGSLDASAALVSGYLEQASPSEWSAGHDVSGASPMLLSRDDSQSAQSNPVPLNAIQGSRLVADWSARLVAIVKGLQPA